MPLSYLGRMKLGDNSSFLKRQEKSSVQTQIRNAQNRLQSAGVDYSNDGSSQNFLLRVLDILSRPGYGATNVIREFTNPHAGSTPQEFDPLAAFWRGLTGQDKAQGKDIFTDLGWEGEKGIFGGEAKWYNPSVAGIAGLALDIFNPLDPVNWLAFGIGDDIIKGSAKGMNALTDAFGATKATQIADILKKGSKSIDDLGAESVGKLAKQVINMIDDPDDLKSVVQMIREGIEETGRNATSKLDYKAMKPLQVGLQNPLSIGNSGMAIKLPGYKASGGKMKLPILYPGKDIDITMRSIPGSEYVTDIISKIAQKVGSVRVGTGATLGESLGKMFSTVFVPNTVPNAVIKKNLTAKNMGDLITISRTTPENVPLSVEELMKLNDDLAEVKLDNVFDFADNMSATDLKQINKGNYLSIENLAKKVGLKGFNASEITDILSDTPFNKTITEIYDQLRVLKPTDDAKKLFTEAAKLRKVMDLMYEQIPEGLKPYFSGVLKAQMTNLYPTDLATYRLGKNIVSSPLMAYEFNYKGVPISVVVNSGEDFNLNAWARVSATFEALDELPETAIQALQGQIDISPIPIKNPDTSMTIGDTIVLGRIDKPTEAHEYGHIWDSVAGDQDSYIKAILSDAQKIDDTLTPDDLYSDYSRSLYDTDNAIGIKEDLADSVSDYIADPKTFRELYPNRAAEIEKMIGNASISREELAQLVTKQRKLSESVAQIPRTETQIAKMVEDIDKFAFKMTWQPGEKTYQSFRGKLNALFEQTNWKTKQWQEQVATIFKGLDEEARKQIMDAAAQITGTEIPGVKKTAEYATNPGEYRFKVDPETGDFQFELQDIDTPEFKEWFKGSKVVDKDGSPLVVYHGTTEKSPFTVFNTNPPKDVGAHFGTKEAANSILAGNYEAIKNTDNMSANIYPVYLSIKNPLEVQDAFGGDVAGTALEIHDALQARGANLYDLTERLKKQTEILDNWPGMETEYMGMTWDEFVASNRELDKYAVEIAKKNGFDGLVYDNIFEGDVFGDNLSWVAFEPNQIKSATGNIGTFSKNSDNILYAEVNKKIDSLFPKRTKGTTPVYHVTTPEIAEEIMNRGYFIPSDIATERNSISNHSTFFAPDPYSAYRWTEQIGIDDNYVMIRGEIPEGLSLTGYDIDNDLKQIYKRGKSLGLTEDQLAPLKSPEAFRDWSDDEAYSSFATALTDWSHSVGFQGRESELLGDILYGWSDEKELAMFDPSKVTNLKAVKGSDIDELFSGPPMVANPNYDPNGPIDSTTNPRFINDPTDTRAYGVDEVRKQLFNVKEEKPLFAEQEFPIFVSRLEEVVDKMPNRMSVDQFKNYLKNKDVKKEEIKWTFIDDLLEGKTHVTKAEVQQWVAGNKLEVQEVWKTDDPVEKVFKKLGINKGEAEDYIESLYAEMGNNPPMDYWRRIDRKIASHYHISDEQAYLVHSAFKDIEGFNDALELRPEVINLEQSVVDATRYSNHTQPGGEEYTELVFILPEDYARPKRGVTGDIDSLKMEYEELASRIDDIREELGSESQEFITMNRRLQELEAQGIATTPVDSLQYRSSHWKEPNVVAHTRFDTRYTEDGRKILFIDEIQSDWHQTGRDKGYRELGYKAPTAEEMAFTKEEVREVIINNKSFGFPHSEAAIKSLENEGLKNFIKYLDDKAIKISPEDMKVLEKYQGLLEKNRVQWEGVPDAPFRNTWDEYVQKRLLRYAADNGYDGIAWSTGKQQADRWRQAITDNIDTIQYNQNSQWLRAYKNNEEVLSRPITREQLPEIVGTDIARKLLDTTPDTFTIQPISKNPSTEGLIDRMPPDMDPVEMLRWVDEQPEMMALRPVDGSQGMPSGWQVVDQNGNAWGYIYHSEEAAQKAIDDLQRMGETVKTVSGTNITIGGEGMRKFYDQQIPSNFKKIGKKFGLNIEEIELDFSGNVNKFYPTEEFDDTIRYYFPEDIEDGMDGYLTRAETFVRFNLEEEYNSVQEFLDGIDPGLRFSSTEDVDKLIEFSVNFADEHGESIDNLEQIRERLYNQVEMPQREITWQDEITGEFDLEQWNYRQEFEARPMSKQQGMWLDPKSRQAIRQQSFPLYAKQDAQGPVDNLTAGWSDRQITALDNFLKWRNSVVKQYRQLGIPINELEKYVPFIPKRVLRGEEADVVKTIFGTGVEQATGDNFDTLLAELSKMDPNLKQRTTKATRPSEVNKLLKSDWLTEDAAVAMSLRGTRAIKAQEFRKFGDEFIAEYGLHATDITKMTGGSVPEGYVAYKVGLDQEGNKIFQQARDVVGATMDDTEIIFLPEEMVNLYNEYLGLMFNKQKKNGLVQIYDSMSRLYKKAAYLWNPGHIFRDFQGNVFNNYLMGVTDPMEYAEGLRVLRGAEGFLDTPNGQIPYKDIYEKAQQMGIVDSIMEHELPTLTGKTESGYSRAMRKATYATDGWTRMTGFIHNLKQGQSFEQAAATTKKFLFDYFDLTPFERKVMKRIIPFYTWTRKNIPLQLEVLVKNPRVFARINDVQNAIAGENIDWKEKPEYIQDMVAIQPKGSDMYVDMDLPYQDLTRLPINSNTLADLLSSINPIIRVPIESITNQKWWTGQELEKYPGEKTDIPVLTTLLEMLGQEQGPQIGARYGGNVLNNIPILTRAGNLLDAVSGKETNDVRNLSRVSTTMGGPAFFDAASVENSADWQERQRLIDLIQLLQDEGYNIPTSSEARKEGRYRKLSRLLSR